MDRPVDRVKEAVSDAVGEGLDAARERFEDAAEDIEQRYRRVAKDARGRAAKVGEVARARYDEAAESVRRGYTKARHEVERVGGDVNDYVKENPGKSILIAAGVGFLIGLLVSRSRDND